MNKIDDGGPAFPCEIGECYPGQNEHQNGPSTAIQYGMSLRDYFAGKVLPSYIEAWDAENASKLAYQYADAMIAARSKP